MALNIKQTVSSNSEINQMQTALNEHVANLNQIPHLSGQPLSQIILKAGQKNTVPHKLGRQAQGYFVTSTSPQANIWNDSPDKTNIYLYSSADCTVSLWVY